MSSIIATVSKIDNCDSLNIVEFDCYGQTLFMMSLDLSQKIRVGTEVKLAVKPSHVIIAKEFSGDISLSNKINTTIYSVDNGQLLSSIKLNFFDTMLESIITVKLSRKMNLEVGDCVICLINASELSIDEVLS